MQTAILFATEGANVLLVDREHDAIQKIAAQVSAKKQSLFPNTIILGHGADVTIEDKVKEVINLAVTKFGRLDIMVSRNSCLLSHRC